VGTNVIITLYCTAQLTDKRTGQAQQHQYPRAFLNIGESMEEPITATSTEVNMFSPTMSSRWNALTYLITTFFFY
jgi:hypothetical protein